MEFYIYVTKACNLNCKYCTQTNFMKISRNDRNELDVKQTADFVLRNLSNKNNNIVFYGGEPLLNQEWIKKFIELTRSKNITFTLQTNGTLLNKIDDFILENLNFIHLSIDGDQKITDNSRGKGVHNIILDNIKKIKLKSEFTGKLLARMTFIPENSIYDSVTYLADSNLFDYIYWQLENSPNKTDIQKTKKSYKKDIQRLINFWINNLRNKKIIRIIPFQAVILPILSRSLYKSYRCGAGTYLVTINSDGNCYSCDELIEPQFKIGTIKDKNIQQKRLSSINRSNFCLNCDIGNICGGRCFKESLKFPTEKFRFYCDMTRILINKIQNKVPQIELMIKNNQITMNDLKYDCFTEEIP